jgi:hypothetical protein
MRIVPPKHFFYLIPSNSSLTADGSPTGTTLVAKFVFTVLLGAVYDTLAPRPGIIFQVWCRRSERRGSVVVDRLVYSLANYQVEGQRQ